MSLLTTFKKPLHELNHRPGGQIPALDALRSFAVLCVIAAHMDKAYHHYGGMENWVSKLPVVRGGWMGVDLFFVLSGYFIGKLLWRELASIGSIRIGRFILRRGLRIWPLYFSFFIFSGFILGRAGNPPWQGWSDLVFLTNYQNHGVVMGSWSLCTEEQFYILAPLLLILGGCFCVTLAGYRRVLWSLLLILPVIRAMTWLHATGSLRLHDADLWFPRIYSPFHTHCDGLVMGMLISNFEVDGAMRNHWRLLMSSWSVPLAIAACLILQKLQRESFDFTGLTLVFGSVVWFLLLNRKSWLGFLESKAFYILSRLSYGMYLNHEYMHERIARAVVHFVPLGGTFPAFHEIVAIGLLATASAAVSVVTFCAIEHPFLQLRDRLLAKRQTVSFSKTNLVALAQGVDLAPETSPAENLSFRHL